MDIHDPHGFALLVIRRRPQQAPAQAEPEAKHGHRRRPGADGTHQAQEAGAGSRLDHLLRQQRVGQCGITVQRPQIEEDIGRQQRLGLRFGDPVDEGLAPFVERQATAGLTGHHATLAQRKAEPRQRVVDVTGDTQQCRPHIVRGNTGRRLEHQSVVLIGAEGLFHPPFRTEGQPAPAHAVEHRAVRVRGAHQIDGACGQRVVQRRQVQRQRLGRTAVAQLGQAETTHGARGVFQRVDIARRVDASSERADVAAQPRVQIVLRNHAEQTLVVIDHRDMAYVVASHQSRRVFAAAIGVEHMQWAAHYSRYRGVERQAGQ